MSDVVVVLPGIMGSELTRNGRPVWSPTLGAAVEMIRTFGRSVRDLQLPDGIGDGPAEDGVEATALMRDLHVLPGIWTPVAGYDRLVARIEKLGFRRSTPTEPGNLVLFPYDWRLSNRYTARRLADVVNPALDRWRAQGGPHADAQLVFVTHSMGGLIARRYVECEGGAERTRRIVTLGTPYRGAAMAVDKLVNGLRPGLGPLSANLTAFSRSLPSLHQLLPEYACVDPGDGELLRVTEVELPELSTDGVRGAVRFHEETNRAAAARPGSRDQLYMIIGTRQPTATTARIAGGRAEMLTTIRDGDAVDDDFGDATVPRTGAVPHGLPLNASDLHSVVEQHGHLQRNESALDMVEEAITARPVVRRAPPTVPIRVEVPELVLRGEPVPVRIAVEGDGRHALRVTTTDESGAVVDSRAARLRDGQAVASLTGLPPGLHTVHVASLGGEVAPVTASVLVWPRDGE